MIYNALSQLEECRLSIVMPVFNEGVRVIPVITTLAFTVTIPSELLIVYDLDDDPTIQVINELCDLFPNIRLVKNNKRGVINAVKTGFNNANCNYIIVWVSYHVDPYGLINEMYRQASEGCDVVSGNRFNKIKRVSRGNPMKKLLSRTGNYLLNRIIGIPFGDITTSVKLYRKQFLKENPIETQISGGWALSTELAVKAAIKGYKLGEVEFLPQNVNMIQGISNFKVFAQLDQYLKWLYYGFMHRKVIRNNYRKH